MGLSIKGRVWKFPDHVNTDLITPGRYLAQPYEQQCQHMFEAIKPGFSHRVKPNDIIVAGKNFGCGSSRESAPQVIKHIHIGGIVAESFGRIFYRNCIAIGLPAISCPGASAIFEENHLAEVDFGKGLIRNINTGANVTALSLSDEMINVLEKGGIVSILREMFATKK